MWLRLPDRLNVLFIVQLPDSLENSNRKEHLRGII